MCSVPALEEIFREMSFWLLAVIKSVNQWTKSWTYPVLVLMYRKFKIRFFIFRLFLFRHQAKRGSLMPLTSRLLLILQGSTSEMSRGLMSVEALVCRTLVYRSTKAFKTMQLKKKKSIIVIKKIAALRVFVAHYWSCLNSNEVPKWLFELWTPSPTSLRCQEFPYL